MADNMNTAPAPEPEAPGAVNAPAKAGFLSTPLGKVLVIVFAAAVGLGVLSAIAFFVLGGALLSNASKAISGQVASQSTPPASNVTTAVVEEAATERKAEPVVDVFTFRNPFVPTVKPPAAATTTTSTTGTGSTTGSTGSATGSGSSNGGSTTDGSGSSGDSDSDASVPANTLALKSITTEDGEFVATFIWNGRTYTAREGDTLEGTPWKVVNLTSTTAEMLYGDSEVTLSVGQGISK